MLFNGNWADPIRSYLRIQLAALSTLVRICTAHVETAFDRACFPNSFWSCLNGGSCRSALCWRVQVSGMADCQALGISAHLGLPRFSSLPASQPDQIE